MESKQDAFVWLREKLREEYGSGKMWKAYDFNQQLNIIEMFLKYYNGAVRFIQKTRNGK